MGLLFWIFKEGARSESPAHYWFWFSGGPYIRNAKGRVEHIVFKSKVLSVCGVPILGFGVFAPDAFLEGTGPIGIGALVLLSIVLEWIFVSDAADRDKYAIEGLSMEELEKAQERD